jgi:hypothetical protein
MKSDAQTPVPEPLQNAGTTLLPAVLRTTVPLIYAFLVHRGVVDWLGINSSMANNVITIGVTVIFYVVLRLAEQHWDKIGWLLGYAQQPVYVKGEVLSVKEIPTPPTTTTQVETDQNPEA